MTLNEYIYIKNIKISVKKRLILGNFIKKSYKERYMTNYVPKIKVKQKGKWIIVNDYPTDFWARYGCIVVKRFVCKMILRKKRDAVNLVNVKRKRTRIPITKAQPIFKEK